MIKSNKTIIIGLIGLKESGKDGIAFNLSRTVQDRINFCKFARPIKNIISQYFTLPNNDLEVIKKYPCHCFENKKKIRDLMKDIAKLFRDYQNDIFIKNLANEVRNNSHYPIQIITDVRFQQEVDFIEQQGGYIVDVYRENIYTIEKKIVKIFGVNFLSKTLVWLINKELAHPSEWGYFALKERAFFAIDNTNFNQGSQQLQKLIDDLLLESCK